MLTPSNEIVTVLAIFATAMTVPTFAKASVLVMGVILTPGARTVCAALRVMGLGDLEGFGKYHRVLSRDSWSPWVMSQLLLQLLMAPQRATFNTFALGDMPLVLLMAQPLERAARPRTATFDETLERRRGEQIKYKGLFRDGVRSSAKHVVKSMGVRWACMAILVKVPWCQRDGPAAGHLWALPFMIVPELSPRTSQRLHKRHRTSVDWARIMMAPRSRAARSRGWATFEKVRRWQPTRELIVVGDGAYAATTLVQYCHGPSNGPLASACPGHVSHPPAYRRSFV